MDWLRGWWQQRMDRQKIIQLRHEMNNLHARLNEKLEGLRPRDEEYQYHVADVFSDMDIVQADIAELETKHLQQRASYWRVPIPQRPYKRQDDNDFWEWHDPHGRYYLSEMGMRYLRKEVHNEWEMWSKPWLSFFALGVSLLSLVISILR